MSVVSVRLPDSDEAYLKKKGISPGVLARDLVVREVKHMRLNDSIDFLAGVARKPRKPVVDLVRDQRDAH